MLLTGTVEAVAPAPEDPSLDPAPAAVEISSSDVVPETQADDFEILPFSVETDSCSTDLQAKVTTAAEEAPETQTAEREAAKFQTPSKEGGKEQASGKKSQKTIVLGPWGGDGGTTWDDGIYSGVREISLVYGHCVDSVTVVYDKNGKPVKAETHGGRGGNEVAEIKLQYPDEFLVGVSGHYCPMVYGGGPVIRSLKFQSNKRTFGPYGVEEGTPFTFTADGGKIVGFKGRDGWYLDAIGFYVSRIPGKKLFQRVQKSLRRLGSSVSRPLTPREADGTSQVESI